MRHNFAYLLRCLQRLTFCIIFLITFQAVQAQKENDANALTWYQYKAQIGLKNNFSVVLDLQHRRQDLVNFSSQQVLRPGIAYSFENDLKLTVGTAMFWHNINGEVPVYRFEARPYTFLEWKQPLGKSMIFHRSRFELRYNRKTAGSEVIDGYNFNYRAGHKLGISIPIRIFGSDKWQIEIYDEVLINFGKTVRFNYLDQNRVYLGIKGRLNPTSSFKLGYMYIFVPSSSTENFATQHTLVLGVSQKF